MAQSFAKSEIDAEVAERVEKAHALWDAAKGGSRLIWDEFPQEAHLVWECGRLRSDGYKLYESKTVANKYRVAPYRCGRIPYCVPCTQAADVGRTMEHLDAFRLFTPKGQPISIWHVVLTAPTPDDRPRDGRPDPWGMAAKQDIGRFARVVRKTLEQWFGAGVTGVMSYQDFGERPFAKQHPHFDVLVNGYKLEAGRPVPVGELNLRDGGRDALSEVYAQNAQAHFGLTATAGDWNVHEVGQSMASRFRIVAYSLREMVDYRKVAYRQEAAAVGWTHYREETVDWTDRRGFRYWHDDYYSRVDNGRQVLRRWFGPMTSRDPRRAVVRAFLGEDPHSVACDCNNCDDWRRLPPEWATTTPLALPENAYVG